MKPVICFIDDSGFEHDLVKYEISPSAPDLEFVQAYTFDETRDLLAAKSPSLFLLDLWGQDRDVGEPYLTPMNELKKKTAGFPTIDQVYGGLDSFQGDINNEFLKRLFAIVDCWRKLFEDACDRIGQNSRYGLFNLQQARLYYPQIPAVFYTRKSLINDAVAMFKAGADGLFIKPTGYNDDDTRRLTREYAPRLLSDLRKIMIQPDTRLKTNPTK
jgi:DNA-binding NarL/FixJ family response regulator